jgi:anthranilate phosphoribosyltransferase
MGETGDVPGALADAGGWPGVLRRLVAGEALTAPEARAAMTDVLEGAATPSQIAAFVVALRIKGETVEEMTGLVGAMLDAADVVPIGELDAVDTCGTGGSASRRTGAFNVSTIASFVIAGAGGRVCKHGNRKASSTSGSADLLEALGVVIDLDGGGVAACVGEAGMGFCFAPRFHPAMRHAVPTRREIGIPTVFNFLGPLANPARLRRQVLGVSDARMAERMVGVLQARGSERALVVHGHDGLDELTTTSPSTVLDLHGGEVRTYVVDAADLGLARATAEDLKGGDVDTNADLARRVLAGEPGPHRDLVALNAAAGLVAAGVAEDLAAGLEDATAAIDDGRAASVLDALVETSRRVAVDRAP